MRLNDTAVTEDSRQARQTVSDGQDTGGNAEVLEKGHTRVVAPFC